MSWHIKYVQLKIITKLTVSWVPWVSTLFCAESSKMFVSGKILDWFHWYAWVGLDLSLRVEWRGQVKVVLCFLFQREYICGKLLLLLENRSTLSPRERKWLPCSLSALHSPGGDVPGYLWWIVCSRVQVHRSRLGSGTSVVLVFRIDIFHWACGPESQPSPLRRDYTQL